MKILSGSRDAAERGIAGLDGSTISDALALDQRTEARPGRSLTLPKAETERTHRKSRKSSRS